MLRQRFACEVPDIDPLDRAVEARALFLFEKPGPMTSELGRVNRSGSGFVSRDNDDPTAEATFNFLRQAQIPRRAAALWNTIPMWNGTRRVTSAELHQGIACVKELIALLPELRVVVLVGKKAERVQPHLLPSGLPIISSAHPSPLVRARSPEMWNAIAQQWSKVRDIIGDEVSGPGRGRR